MNELIHSAFLLGFFFFFFFFRFRLFLDSFGYIIVSFNQNFHSFSCSIFILSVRLSLVLYFPSLPFTNFILSLVQGFPSFSYSVLLIFLLCPFIFSHFSLVQSVRTTFHFLQLIFYFCIIYPFNHSNSFYYLFYVYIYIFY